MRTALRMVLESPIVRFDPDTRAYITAVERADGQALEPGVRTALDTFVRGCKADGIWDAIKASCIMAGARTLAGALVPLKGAAPTSFNFVSGDYNRKTGLKGDGSTKYLDSNRNNNDDPQDNKHLAIFVSGLGTTKINVGAGAGAGVSGSSGVGRVNIASRFTRNNCSAPYYLAGFPDTGLWGSSRSAAGSYVSRFSGINNVVAAVSQSPFAGDIRIFHESTGAGGNISADRISYYSIG